MIDWYTKVVLTIIAAALVAIVVQGASPPALALSGERCGEWKYQPCHVKIVGDVFANLHEPILVRIDN